MLVRRIAMLGWLAVGLVEVILEGFAATALHRLIDDATERHLACLRDTLFEPRFG